MATTLTRRSRNADGSRETHSFSTVDEMLAISWLRIWSHTPAILAENGPFHRFSQSPHELDTLLMAEWGGGNTYWVIGHLSKPVDGLPVWQHPKETPDGK